MERPGATTMRGNPLTLLGPELKAGDKAPDFEAVNDGLQPVNLAGTGQAVRIFSVVPSLDTPVCDAQTKRFNEEAAKLPGVEILHHQHGPAVRAEALVRRFRRGQDQDAVRSPLRLVRRELWDADQGSAHREPRDFCAGQGQHHQARRVREGSGRSSQLRSGAGGGAVARAVAYKRRHNLPCGFGRS